MIPLINLIMIFFSLAMSIIFFLRGKHEAAAPWVVGVFMFFIAYSADMNFSQLTSLADDMESLVAFLDILRNLWK